MIRLDAAQALRDDGHDVVRASEVGQDRAEDQQILQKAIDENRFLVTLDRIKEHIKRLNKYYLSRTIWRISSFSNKRLLNI